MKYILFILFRYYSNESNKLAAYVQSMSILLAVLAINIFTILLIFESTYLLDSLHGDRVDRYLIILLCYVVPGYLIIFSLVKIKDLERMELENRYKKIYGILVLWYIILSFVAFFAITVAIRG